VTGFNVVLVIYCHWYLNYYYLECTYDVLTKFRFFLHDPSLRRIEDCFCFRSGTLHERAKRVDTSVGKLLDRKNTKRQLGGSVQGAHHCSPFNVLRKWGTHFICLRIVKRLKISLYSAYFAVKGWISSRFSVTCFDFHSYILRRLPILPVNLAWQWRKIIRWDPSAFINNRKR